VAERITTSALHRATGEIIERAMRGESFELTRHGRVVARLSPAETVADVTVPVEHVKAKARGFAAAAGITTSHTGQTSSASSSAVGPMQVEVTDASHPSRRPVAETTPLTAQAQRDQILNNLGGKRSR